MILPELGKVDLRGKKVLLRADLDIAEGSPGALRLLAVKKTLDKLGESGVIIIGHKGRPQGKAQGELSLEPISQKLEELTGRKINFVYDISGQEATVSCQNLKNGEVLMLENLRFDPREEANDPSFAKSLSLLGEVYINEAFGASHRAHASIVGIPKLLPHAAGVHFCQEVENLSRVIQNPTKPVISILGGVKEDKLNYVGDFLGFSDKVYLVGALPKMIEEPSDPRVVISKLNPDKEDITLNSIEEIEKDITHAGTIVISGPVGKFEDEGQRLGTKRVFEKIASSTAFKVAGGGDTQSAISLLGLTPKFDWISVGGGAMLEFLAKKSLPGINALLN